MPGFFLTTEGSDTDEKLLKRVPRIKWNGFNRCGKLKNQESILSISEAVEKKKRVYGWNWLVPGCSGCCLFLQPVPGHIFKHGVGL